MSDLTVKYEAQLKAKQNAGRYTLEEAAAQIELETGEPADDMLKMLMEAARSGALPVYAPGRHFPYRYGDGFASVVRELYEEAYFYDLNTWLADNFKLTKWRFPKPATPTTEPAEIEKTYQLREQEKAIRAKLIEQGHDPHALPPNERGKPGVKNACKIALSDSPLFAGTTTFDKAWERMSGLKDIKYSD